MKRIIRDRYLTPEEAEKYNRVREKVEQEFPHLIKRHHQRMATHFDIITEAYAKCGITFAVLKDEDNTKVVAIVKANEVEKYNGQWADDMTHLLDYYMEFNADGSIASY